jgi:lipopolysaccharide transport system ATP-binding protein
MSSEAAIRVENISKSYAIWSSPAARLHGPMLGQLGQIPFMPSRVRDFCQRVSRESFKNFYALQDISFEVQKGESIGIVGRNGAGKSTLLQIIVGTLQPTTGSVTVNGRVAALLELGSGFNPEFTGRENVYLNAAILGFSRAEIDGKFDEITAFADIGEFIDQPVKTYSTGMMVRLAFAVAINVDAEILVVDEALAVGDFAFQHKCLAKFTELRSEGVTVLFVTHDLPAIQANCERAILLENGRMTAIGPAREVCDRFYQNMIEANAAHDRAQQLRASRQQAGAAAPAATANSNSSPLRQVQPSARWGRGAIEVAGWEMLDAQGTGSDVFFFRDKATIVMRLKAHQDIPRCFPGFVVRDRNGYHLTGITNRTCGVELDNVKAGEEIELRFKTELLYRADNYSLLLNIAVDEYGRDFYDVCENVGNFSIVAEPDDRPAYGYGRVYVPTTLEVHRNTNAAVPVS